MWNNEAAGGFNLHLPRGWHGNFQLCSAAALLLVELRPLGASQRQAGVCAVGAEYLIQVSSIT